MPKSIIREFDNSTTGSSLSVNFSVFVPGYMADETEGNDTLVSKAEKEGIYDRNANIYTLNSQAQFDKYIGKYASNGNAAVAPELKALNPQVEDTNVEHYRSYLTREQIVDEDMKPLTDRIYCTGTTISSNHAHFGKDGRWYKVIGEDTYFLKKVDVAKVWDDFCDAVLNPPEADPESTEEQIARTSTKYFIINGNNIGEDEATKIDQIGNQIAYELLGLGYTVYFKPLDKTKSTVLQLSSADFWDPLRNKSTYRIRYLLSGGCYDVSVAKQMAKIAQFASDESEKSVSLEKADTFGFETGRGDCIALLDIDEEGSSFDEDNADVDLTTRSGILAAFGNAADDLGAARNKYSAIFAPRVQYKLSYPDGTPYSSDQLFPCSFHYLACAAQAQQRYAEWYAVAGYTRGISPLTIERTTYTFGDIDINTLAPRVINNYTGVGINLILNERGNYYLWGNRTAELLTSDGLIFSHFLNIRQLCCTIKQVLFDATRKFTFDPNSDLLWINFCNAIRPTLEAMKGDQGIRGYKITKVATDKKALLKAKIRIVPIEAVEDFDISVYLEDSLSGIVVSADETEAE